MQRRPRDAERSAIPNGICPVSQFSSSLLSLRAPNTQNDDRNPARIASRNLFDLTIGEDNLLHRKNADKRTLSASLTIVNLTNKVRAVQLPVDVLGHALCESAVDHGRAGVPLLGLLAGAQGRSSGRVQQQPQLFPRHASRPSFSSRGTAASAASESNHAMPSVARSTSPSSVMPAM